MAYSFSESITLKCVASSLVVVIFCLTTINGAASDCPPASVTSPCICQFDNKTQGDVIFCDIKTAVNFRDIFTRISARVSQKHYQKLILRNDVITEIGANTTRDLTFDEIKIYSSSLIRIHSSAFLKAARKVKHVYIYGNNLQHNSRPYSLFGFLNTFLNVQRIDVYTNAVNRIPTKAFKSLLKLKELNLQLSSKMESPLTIGEKAFYRLDNLKYLNLDGNKIMYISRKAFTFKNPSNNRLFIYLWYNEMNSTTFENGWLNQINRPVRLDLEGNKITYLEKGIFKRFLNRHKDNEIEDLQSNPLDCSDCRNAWLMQERSKYSKRVKDVHCDGGKNGPTIFDSSYEHCPEVLCTQNNMVFAPCECQKNSRGEETVIVCGGEKTVDLTKVFHDVSNQIVDTLQRSLRSTRSAKPTADSIDNQKHFQKLLITNNALEDISANATKDLTFDEIEIAAENLNRIHSDAFKGTASRVKRFIVTEETSSLNSGERPYNSFDLLNYFVNAEDIRFLDSSVFNIPAHAFKKLNKLKTLFFGRVILQPPNRLSISNDAFYNLNSLTRLNLTLNRINHVPKFAFHFQFRSSNRLQLSLVDNDLNATSFQIGALTSFKRPTSINLSYNRIKYLDEDIFRSFLDIDIRNEIVDLSYNPLDCNDCRHMWLINDLEKYEGRVKGAYCNHQNWGTTIFGHKLDHCK